MRAIVHIGAEKTGTKTIQEFLHQNRLALTEQGIAYPESLGFKDNRNIAIFCMDYENIDAYIRQLGIVSKSKRRLWNKSVKKSIKDELGNMSSNISKVILSSEHFQSRLRSSHEIQTLFNVLKPYFKTIKILVYLRRQDQVAVSLYSTMCRAGGTRDNVLPKNATPNSEYYNYYNLIKKWEGIFGKQNIIIRIFDKSKFINGDLLHDFSFSSGIELSNKLFIPKRMNKKLSKDVQKTIVYYNKYFPRFVKNKPAKFNNQLRNYLINNLGNEYTDQETLPTKKEAMKFHETFVPSNKKLADEYLSADSIFSNDFSMYPDELNKAYVSDGLLRDIFKLLSKFLDNYYT